MSFPEMQFRIDRSGDVRENEDPYLRCFPAAPYVGSQKGLTATQRLGLLLCRRGYPLSYNSTVNRMVVRSPAGLPALYQEAEI